jgi:hypothetical protein
MSNKQFLIPPLRGSRILSRIEVPLENSQASAQARARASSPEDQGLPVCRYYLYAMETFANPDVWIARESALGTMVTHTIVYDVERHLPDFLCADRPLLRNIRDSPVRVSTIRLQWDTTAQRLFEYERAPRARDTRMGLVTDPMSLDGWPACAHDKDMSLADPPMYTHDSLVITVSPKNVAHADYIGVVKQWRGGINYTHNSAMPKLQVVWLNYIHQCIMLWSSAPMRPNAPMRPDAPTQCD